MDERKRRLFVGIDLDDRVRHACSSIAQELRRAGLAGKYEAPEKLHVTLAFLGFVEPARLDRIVSTLRTVAAGSAPLAVSLDKLGAFPHERRPRVVYVGAREQGPRFRSLAGDVRRAFAQLGFEFRDDPVAHVTIARTKESKRALPSIEFAPIDVQIHALALFESFADPAHETSRYEIAARFALGGHVLDPSTRGS